MNKKENINNWVDEALNSLDDVKRATGKPYLLTRLNTKMQNSHSSVWDNALQFISKPMVALVCMLIIIAFNVLIISRNYNTFNTINEEQAVTVDEYNANITALNYTENIEP
jgi:membrane-bound ClpP family serine protease